MWQGEAYEIRRPARHGLPLVVASPHSGDLYPPDLLAASRLTPLELRRSEDFLVHELVAAAPSLGAPLLRARFPRAYVDVNREPYEIDPAILADTAPDYANTRSPRVAAGLGTVARVVASGQEIYAHRLTTREVLTRIERCYVPYHKALTALLEETRARFGFCLLLDCHSMPSLPPPADPAGQGPQNDMVLGDCHGTTSEAGLVERTASVLQDLGYRVALNVPYAGGFITRHYGQPEAGVHALQLEIARRLYMDEAALTPTAGFPRLAADLTRLIEALGAWQPKARPLPRAAE